jgi:hypothetical protein
MLAAGPAAAAAGKYCAIYKGDTLTTAATLSMAKPADCQKRAKRSGGDGYGLGCQIDAGAVLATAKTPIDSDTPVNPTDWQTSDQKAADACNKEWGNAKSGG